MLATTRKAVQEPDSQLMDCRPAKANQRLTGTYTRHEQSRRRGLNTYGPLRRLATTEPQQSARKEPHEEDLAMGTRPNRPRDICYKRPGRGPDSGVEPDQ